MVIMPNFRLYAVFKKIFIFSLFSINYKNITKFSVILTNGTHTIFKMFFPQKYYLKEAAEYYCTLAVFLYKY